MVALLLTSILIAGQIPPLGNAGTCSRYVFVAQGDSAWFHMRWYGAPPPYRYPVVEDSMFVARNQTASWRFDTSSAVGHWAPPFAGRWLYTEWPTRMVRVCRDGVCRDSSLVGCGRSGFVAPRP